MSSAITKGNDRNELARIYDRLRKRRLRLRDRYMIGPTGHAAYVAGVKDALNAVEATNTPKAGTWVQPTTVQIGDKVKLNIGRETDSGAIGTVTHMHGRDISVSTEQYPLPFMYRMNELLVQV